MHILFLSPGDRADYQCDMLFHGLRSVAGCTVTDVHRLSYLYRGDTSAATLRGGGFTLYGLLEEDPSVRRDNIPERIRGREFDLVIFGSVQRSSRYLGDVLTAYAPSEIAFIDGEDHQVILHALLGRGVYFKREFPGYATASERVRDWVKPINFAIPAEKIAATHREKTRDVAFIDPRDRSTYIYGNEADYVADYQQSRFGLTIKKAGWDCLRHYEILANQCIPYFMDLPMCPPGTMTQLPKEVLLQVNECILQRGVMYFSTVEGKGTWGAFQARLQTALRDRLTTKSLAEYVLATCAAMREHQPRRSYLAKTQTTMALHAFNLLSPSGESAWRRTLLNGAYLAMVPGDR